MSRIGRRAFTAGSLSLAACASSPRSADPAPSASSEPAEPAPEPGPPPFGPVVGLTGVNPVIWSWTTSEQIDELARGAPLFSRETSASMGAGLLFTLLEQRGSGVVADLAARLKAGRFGWFNPWSTSRGFEGEAYGTELLRIAVAPDALFMVIESSTFEGVERVRWADVAGARVPGEVAEAAPERVVGVVFTHDQPLVNACRGTGGGGGLSPYREVYLGNPTRVASWSARSDLVARDLARVDADLAGLARRAYSDGGDFCAWSSSVVNDAWRTTPTSAVGRYLSSLAFPTGEYVPTHENIAAIRAALAAVPILPPGLGG
jgi:hypothetical protein